MRRTSAGVHASVMNFTLVRVSPGPIKPLRGKMRPSTRARPGRAPMLAAALCLSLAGCQTPVTGPGATLAADQTDPCQNERAAFASSKTFFQDQIVSGAVSGAAV